jgi:hypothetical protein
VSATGDAALAKAAETLLCDGLFYEEHLEGFQSAFVKPSAAAATAVATAVAATAVAATAVGGDAAEAAATEEASQHDRKRAKRQRKVRAFVVMNTYMVYPACTACISSCRQSAHTQ